MFGSQLLDDQGPGCQGRGSYRLLLPTGLLERADKHGLRSGVAPRATLLSSTASIDLRRHDNNQ